MYQRNRMYNFLSIPAFSIGVAKNKILLAKSYILFFGRIIFKKNRGRKNKKNNLMAEYNILKLYNSATGRIKNKKKYIIRPVAYSNKKNVWFGQNFCPNRTDTVLSGNQHFFLESASFFSSLWSGLHTSCNRRRC